MNGYMISREGRAYAVRNVSWDAGRNAWWGEYQMLYRHATDEAPESTPPWMPGVFHAERNVFVEVTA